MKDYVFHIDSVQTRLVVTHKSGRRIEGLELVAFSDALNRQPDFEAENAMLRSAVRKVEDRAEDADRFERWLAEIGRACGCGHIDEQLVNCVTRSLQGDDE